MDDLGKSTKAITESIFPAGGAEERFVLRSDFFTIELLHLRAARALHAQEGRGIAE